MKRNKPLQRYTPLSNWKPLKRFQYMNRKKRMRRASDDKINWYRLYLMALSFLLRQNRICRVCGVARATQGHHPFGQKGALILLFWPVCGGCHSMIETFKKAARIVGLILYPITLKRLQ